MLFVSILTSDRSRDVEFFAAIWFGLARPSIKIIGAYNLANNKRIMIWEGESAADLQYMDKFNQIGVLETYPAFDRTEGYRQAFAKDIDSFAKPRLARGGPGVKAVERGIELRRRAMEAPDLYTALSMARKMQAEQGIY